MVDPMANNKCTKEFKRMLFSKVQSFAYGIKDFTQGYGAFDTGVS